MQIRKAMESDLERLTAIYNQAILDGNRTCDTEPFPTEARRTWLLEHDQERFPLFTCLLKGKVVGYAYLSPYRFGRPALADTHPWPGYWQPPDGVHALRSPAAWISDPGGQFCWTATVPALRF